MRVFQSLTQRPTINLKTVNRALEGSNGLLFSTEAIHPGLTDQPDPRAQLGQTQIRVVFAEGQSILRATSKHSVWFICPSRCQIFDQDCNVADFFRKRERIAILRL